MKYITTLTSLLFLSCASGQVQNTRGIVQADTKASGQAQNVTEIVQIDTGASGQAQNGTEIIPVDTGDSGPAQNSTEIGQDATRAVAFPGVHGCWRVNNDIYDCSSSRYLEFLQIKLIPAKPKKGEKFSIHVKGVTKRVIESDTIVDTTVSLDIYKVYREQLNFCDSFWRTEARCPMHIGRYFETTKEYDLPDGLPSGEYHIDSKGLTGNGHQIFWIKARLNL